MNNLKFINNENGTEIIQGGKSVGCIIEDPTAGTDRQFYVFSYDEIDPVSEAHFTLNDARSAASDYFNN